MLSGNEHRTVMALVAVGCVTVCLMAPRSMAFAAVPAPLQVSVGLPVTVIADGAALRVPADVVCSSPQAMLTLNLVQRSGERIAHGTFLDRAECIGMAARMVVSMPAQDAPFHPGLAFLQATITDCSNFPCAIENDEVVVSVVAGDIGSAPPAEGGLVASTGTRPPTAASARAESTAQVALATPITLLAEGTATRVPVDFTCGMPRTGFVAVTVTQRIGAQIAHGAVEDSRVCADKPDRIVITIPAVDTRFGGGPAFVQARLTSCILNPEIPCYSARDEAAVTLPEPTG